MRLSRLLVSLLLILGLTSAVHAQTVLTSTTLSAAITGPADQQISIASTTNWVASGSTGQTFALVDREIMAVRTINTTSKVVQVTRGASATRPAPHISGATIWFIPSPLAIQPYVPSGQCTRTALLYVPMIVGGIATTPQTSEVGGLWDCLGVTTAGQWVQTAPTANVSVYGTAVASATSITPTGTYFQVSGTVNPVNTIVVPAGWATGNCLTIEPTGVWVTGTGGNIVIASTSVVGKILGMCWNGATSKWQPTY